MSDAAHITETPTTKEERETLIHRANCIVALVRRYCDDEEVSACPHLIHETLITAESLLIAAEEFTNGVSE